LSRDRAASKYHENVLLLESEHVKIVKKSNKNVVNQTLQLTCHEIKRRAQTSKALGEIVQKENMLKTHQGQF
jgi:hypothetical protein